MASMISNFVNDLFLGPLHRKVTRYLNETTHDSVCADLGKVLSPQLSGWRKLDHLQTIFVKYCVQYSSDHQPYWNEESFKSHIRDTHSSAAVSDAAVQLLWRSFHFYAHHPFPRDLQDARIDYDAFQRAALLTVFRCDGLLGTRELDWYWRRDDAFFNDASLVRMFRSLAPQDKVGSEGSTDEDDMRSSLSDAMDVLVMLGPQFIHAMPSEGQLEAVARRLFASENVAARGAVRRQDVSVLMNLLLRMRLRKGKWGRLHHYGSIMEAGPADEELTRVLVASLAGDANEIIAPEQLLKSKVTMIQERKPHGRWTAKSSFTIPSIMGSPASTFDGQGRVQITESN
ncbi:hypothetical protein LQW54_001909 [Pestalotiopsis sp. IQ-011]